MENTLKRISALLTAAIMLFGIMLSANAIDLTDSDYEYIISNGEVTVTKYNGEEKTVIIPNVLADCPVTAIGEHAFEERDDIDSLIIPDSVISIGDSAFDGCEKIELVHYWGDDSGWEKINIASNNESLTSSLRHYATVIPAVAPTCADEGLTEGRICAECDLVLTQQQKVNKLDHSYSDWIVEKEADCTENGSRHRQCDECGETDIEIIEAMGHAYEAYQTIDKEPTCAENGEKSRHCSRCDSRTDITKTDKLPHNYKLISIKTPTCTEEGEKIFKCTNCGNDNVEKTFKKLHHYENKLTVATVKTNGKITPICSVCAATKKELIIYSPNAVIVEKASFTHTGKEIKPTVTVKDSKGNVIFADNYTVSYSNNKNVGTATVTVTFRGNYSGTLTATFKINPKSTSVSKLEAKEKGFKVTWKKQTTQVSGYEIQYAATKKFNDKTVKTVTVKKSKTDNKKISKLKENTKYYVRIRTYKTVDGKKYYSDWSKVKSIKTLKTVKTN